VVILKKVATVNRSVNLTKRIKSPDGLRFCTSPARVMAGGIRVTSKQAIILPTNPVRIRYTGYTNQREELNHERQHEGITETCTKRWNARSQQ
jgi:hypothetical protein